MDEDQLYIDVPLYTPPRLGTDMLQPDLIHLEADPDAVPLGLRLGGRLSPRRSLICAASMVGCGATARTRVGSIAPDSGRSRDRNRTAGVDPQLPFASIDSDAMPHSGHSPMASGRARTGET